LRQALASLPQELIEAGLLETNRPSSLFLRVIVPCVAPALVALATLTFCEVWGYVEQPMILFDQSERMPLSVVMTQHMVQRNIGGIFALATLSCAPILGIYVFSRRAVFSAMENLRF